MLRRINKDEFNKAFKILDEAFPIDEKRSYNNQRALMDSKSYSIVVEDIDFKGILAVWNFDNFRFIEHFAIAPEYRNNRLGEGMLKEYINEEDNLVVLEVELEGSPITDRRIGFYKRAGFMLNDFDYIQPPMEEGKSEVPLRIMSYPRELSNEEYIGIRNIIYKYVYSYEKTIG